MLKTIGPQKVLNSTVSRVQLKQKASRPLVSTTFLASLKTSRLGSSCILRSKLQQCDELIGGLLLGVKEYLALTVWLRVSGYLRHYLIA